jgi:hypothetical protein
MSAIWICGGNELVEYHNGFIKNQRLATIASHALVCLMMVCLTISFVQFLGRFLPMGGSLPLWGGVIAGEAFLSYRVTKAKSPFSTEWLLARGAEWIVLLAAIKLIVELQHGWGTLLSDLPRWEQNFGPAFFDSEYMSVLFVLITVWVLSAFFATDLAEMVGSEPTLYTVHMDNKQIAQVQATAALYGMRVDDDILPSNRRDIHNRILSRTLALGVVMTIIAGLLRQDRVTLWQSQPIAQVSVINVVLYFILGLGLFSQTNFLALRAAWGYEHAKIQHHLGSRWVFYSLIFVLGLGVLALILPTRYSLGFLDTLMYLLGFLRIIVEFIIGIIMLPVLLIFRLLALILGRGSDTSAPIENKPVAPIETQAPDISVHTNLPWWDVFKSFLFWGFFIAILGFAIYQYVKQNQALLAALRSLPAWLWIKQVWQWLRGQFRTVRSGMKTVVQAGWKKLRAFRITPLSVIKWRFMNPYRFTLRQQVIFYYLALIRRGKEAGLPRHPSQTPYEYAQFIGPNLIEQTEAVSDMTEGFLNARYSLHEATPEQASRVKQAWVQVRKVLIAKRRGSEGREPGVPHE